MLPKKLRSKSSAPTAKKRSADPFALLAPVEPARRKREAEYGLRGVYLVLAAVFVSAVVGTIHYAGVPLVTDFGPNVASEAGGILITLIFVQRVLDRQERSRRLRASIGALRRGGRSVNALLETWGELLKGTLRRTPSPVPATFDELLTPFATEGLVYLDPTLPRKGGDGPQDTWLRAACARFRACQHAINEIIVTYGDSLDAEYLEALDELVDDPFLDLLYEFSVQDRIELRTWRVRLNAARAHREAHFERLAVVAQLHNALSGEAARVRSRRTAPRTGSLGVELPLDHDLRVSTAIEATWWRKAPAVGSLRTEEERQARPPAPPRLDRSRGAAPAPAPGPAPRPGGLDAEPA